MTALYPNIKRLLPLANTANIAGNTLANRENSTHKLHFPAAGLKAVNPVKSSKPSSHTSKAYFEIKLLKANEATVRNNNNVSSTQLKGHSLLC